MVIMRARSAWIPLAASVLLAVGAPGAPAAGVEQAPAGAVPEQPSRAVLQDATQKRAAAGLPSTSEDVAGVFARADYRTSEYIGTAVTPEEEGLLAGRDRLIGAAGAAEAALLLGVPSYSSGYMDHATGDLVFSFTQPPSAELRSQLSKRLAGANIRYAVASYSLAELRGVHSAVSAAMQSGRLLPVTKVGIPEKRNRVLITFTGPAAPVVAELRSLVGDRGLSSILLEPSQGLSPKADRDRQTGKAFGGLWNSRGCTIALSNAESRSKPGQFYVVTAGHCGSVNDFVYMGITGPGDLLGVVIKNHYREAEAGGTRNCDCMLIGLGDRLDKRSSVVLINNDSPYRYSALARDYSVNGDQGSYFISRQVCLSGAKTAEETNQVQCSQIEDRTVDFRIGTGMLVDHVSTTSLRSTGGGSGGPFGAGGVFMGVFFGGVENRPTFSKSSNLGILNVDMRFNAGY